MPPKQAGTGLPALHDAVAQLGKLVSATGPELTWRLALDVDLRRATGRTVKA